MKLTPDHKALIRLLAAEAVKQFLEEQQTQENVPMPATDQIPIEQFYFDPSRNKFIYRPTGQVWKRAGVDALVGPVEGMRATDWLKLYAVGR